MSSIQPAYIQFTEIIMRDFMPVDGFKVETVEVKHLGANRRTKDDSRDASLVIETQDAHDKLVVVFKSIATDRKMFRFTKLTVSADVEKIELDTFMRVCPDLTSIDIPSNQYIAMAQLLRFPNLMHLHIRDANIHWDESEKSEVLSRGYRQNLQIMLQSGLYRFDYPSRFFFRSGFILLNMFLLLGITRLVAIPLVKEIEGHTFSLNHFNTRRSFVPALFVIGSLIFQYYLYLHLVQKRQDRAREIIREKVKS